MAFQSPPGPSLKASLWLLLGAFALLIAACASPPPGTLPDADLGPAIDSYIDDFTATNQFTGLVLVARDGEPIFSAAYGLADATPHFKLEAADGMFTAIAVAQLVEQSKLSAADLLDTNDETQMRALIARVSGQGYHTYLHTNIFQPAGMEATGMAQPNGSPCISPHDASGSGCVVLTTAEDLLAFDQALRSSMVLSPRATEALFNIRPDLYTSRQADTEHIIRIAGGQRSYLQMEMHMNRGYSVIVLANDQQIAESIAIWIEENLAH